MEEVAVEGRHEDKFHFEYVKLEIAVGLQVIRQMVEFVQQELFGSAQARDRTENHHH